jgi:hypothetical protein
MSLDEHPPVRQSLDEHSTPSSTSKKPWISPKLVLIFELGISNNASGSGDGDAAFAHS